MTNTIARTSPGQRQHHEALDPVPAPLGEIGKMLESKGLLFSLLDQDDIDKVNEQLTGQPLEVKRLIILRWFDIVELNIQRQDALDKQNGHPSTQLWVWCKVADIENQMAQKAREIEELIGGNQ